MLTSLQLWALRRWRQDKERKRLQKRLEFLYYTKSEAEQGLAGMANWPEPVREKLQGQLDDLQRQIEYIETQLK